MGSTTRPPSRTTAKPISLQTLQCGGPFGPDSTYCATVIH
jgi:hypothetical protein